MLLRNEIDECLGMIRLLEDSFQTAKKEGFSLSFFEENNSRIYRLKKAVNELESLQWQLEEQQRKNNTETETNHKKEESMAVSVELLADKIGKKLYSDIQSSLSLNDRFRFQKSLFYDDGRLMSETLGYLNGLDSFGEAEKYLNEQFAWDWESESPAAFREILEKHFP
ncbi:MAG: hypothetical protein LBH12_00670 [Dysgonamonadaceae bacterium]|jgi:hypothetical protein|nr:hypothetical protein [Dysgonamonadaceae bacterium]